MTHPEFQQPADCELDTIVDWTDEEFSEFYGEEDVDEIWDNPNWEICSAEYVGDGWHHIIMEVKHNGFRYWTKAAYDGEIHDFGEHSLVRSKDGTVIAEYKEDATCNG